ncbi:MAG: hypothetical protein WCS70_01065 [Verrucomicrobiota bacterium]
MYRDRRRSHRASQHPETRELRQQLIKAKRRRSDKLLMRIIIFGPLLLYFAFEMGRSFLYMQSVRSFAASIDQLPPAEVKAKVKRYAIELDSRNPLIRNGAIAALKIATGWNVGSEAAEWKARWVMEEPYWEYRSRPAMNVPAGPEVDWRKDLPKP